MAVAGGDHGITLRFVTDAQKLDAAYENSETLAFRDAGCIIATLGMCAEWLNLAMCPLGFVGQDMLNVLGFPRERFLATGAVQITA